MSVKAAEDAWVRLVDVTAAETSRRAPKSGLMTKDEMTRQKWLAAQKM